MIYCPPANKIAEALNIDIDKAKLIRSIIKREIDILALDCIPKTLEWRNKCYHMPRMREVMVMACDEIAGTYGTETVEPQEDWSNGYPRIEYLNVGDSYASTLFFDFSQSRAFISCFGDIVERMEREHD